MFLAAIEETAESASPSMSLQAPPASNFTKTKLVLHNQHIPDPSHRGMLLVIASFSCSPSHALPSPIDPRLDNPLSPTSRSILGQLVEPSHSHPQLPSFVLTRLALLQTDISRMALTTITIPA